VATVGILGAGLSGIAMGIELERHGIDDYVIYEKQPDVGGTWLVNTYPGLHCDIPSHIYCYSFEPNPDFSMVYSGQAEIQAYLRRCTEEYGLLDHIRFDTTVESARYREQDGSWSLGLDDGSTPSHRVLVAATGGLTEPHFPKIDALDRFAGPLWHSAAWRHDVDLRGRRVAVIGSAASAVQVVPEVAKVASQVSVFSRTPNWITPRNNHTYTEDQRAALRSDQEWHRVRRQQYRAGLLWQRAFEKRPEAIEELRTAVMDSIRAAIDDPDLIEALTPDYEPGCKRILVSDDYYLALALDHVSLIPHGATELTESAVVADDGSSHEADVVIFCTGYKLGGRADGRPAVAVHGRGGEALRSAQARAPEMYRGVATPGFPNYFTVGGINGAPGHAPVFLVSEVAADYIARWIDRLVTDDLVSIEAKAEATHAYSETIQAELQGMSWAGDCPGWYRDKQGRILPFFPGSWGRLRREMKDLHEGDFITT
jgi:cation diffusion facilitator CzcD-associated flavoprotein CzcO